MELFRFRGEYLTHNGTITYERIAPKDFMEVIFFRESAFVDGLPFEEELCKEYLDWRDGKPLRPEQPCRYNAIALSIKTNRGVDLSSERKTKHYVLTNSLKGFELALASDFLIMSPITYVGRNRTSRNARFFYAFAIDLDGVGKQQIIDLIHQMNIKELPIANLIVNSGHGLHLYYILEKPIALFQDAKQALYRLKSGLTSKVWNMYTSTIKEKQFQGIFQGFRVPGSKTKMGNEVEVYRTDIPNYSISELSSWVTNPTYKLSDKDLELLEKGIYNPDRLKLDVAKDKYPEWYERVIVRGDKKRNRWVVKRALYDWWLRRIGDISSDEVKEGHRYFCLLALAMFAKKCNVPYEELRKDCLKLVERMDKRTTSEDNHFTEEDAEDALHAYKEDYCTFPRDTIARLTAIPLKVNKRNGRKQNIHLEISRMTRDLLVKVNGKSDWREGNGRPLGSVKSAETAQKAQIVREWRSNNPESTNKALCARETGLSRTTVHKWWGT